MVYGITARLAGMKVLVVTKHTLKYSKNRFLQNSRHNSYQSYWHDSSSCEQPMAGHSMSNQHKNVATVTDLDDGFPTVTGPWYHSILQRIKSWTNNEHLKNSSRTLALAVYLRMKQLLLVWTQTSFFIACDPESYNLTGCIQSNTCCNPIYKWKNFRPITKWMWRELLQYLRSVTTAESLQKHPLPPKFLLLLNMNLRMEFMLTPLSH